MAVPEEDADHGEEVFFREELGGVEVEEFEEFGVGCVFGVVGGFLRRGGGGSEQRSAATS